jgi:hypothetical protein
MKPWTAMMPMKRRSERIHEFACHEGTLMLLYGMLGAARADENVAGQAANKVAR